MRGIILLAFFGSCLAANETALLQHGVDVGTGRTCFTFTEMKEMKTFGFSFQSCNENSVRSSFITLTVPATPDVSVSGTINFAGCWFCKCDPTGGKITFERSFGDKKTKNAVGADNGHGQSKAPQVLSFSAFIGFQITMDRSVKYSGVDVSFSVYGGADLSIFDGLIAGRGTFTGSIYLRGLSFDSSANNAGTGIVVAELAVSVEARLTVRFLFAEFHVALLLTASTTGELEFKVDISMGSFFGLDNCYPEPDKWVRRRHWCEHYPRRRNQFPGDEWCWGIGAWSTCGEYGTTPFPFCRLAGVNPMCQQKDARRRRRERRRRHRRRRRRRERRRRERRRRERRRRRTRRRRKLNNGQGCQNVWHGDCHSGKCAMTVSWGSRKCCAGEICNAGNCWCTSLGNGNGCDWNEQCNSRWCHWNRCHR